MQRLHPAYHAHSATAANRRGFVLFAVLALLTLTVVIFSQFARQSFKTATQARQQERHLQDRWATWSLANGCLAKADRILASTNTANSTEKAFQTVSIQLGAHQYTVAINDLDSAVNLNTLSRNAGMTGVRRAIQKATTKLPGTRFAIQLPRTRSVGNPIVMDSWGQVFASTQQASNQMATAIPVLQQSVTCWGSGKLNINRASDENIRLLGSSLGRSGLFGRIIEERNTTESVNLKQVIESAASSAKDTQLLQVTLGNRSTSWSVLITSDSGSPALLTILESGSGNFANRRSSFSF